MTKTADIYNKRNTIQTTKLRIKNNLNRLKMLFLYKGNKRMQKKKIIIMSEHKIICYKKVQFATLRGINHVFFLSVI